MVPNEQNALYLKRVLGVCRVLGLLYDGWMLGYIVDGRCTGFRKAVVLIKLPAAAAAAEGIVLEAWPAAYVGAALVVAVKAG